MRLTILVLVLSAGTAAFCQSTMHATGSLYKAQQNPPIFTWPGTDFSTVPPVWRGSSFPRGPVVIEPNMDAARRLDRTQIDPQIVVHPPKASLGTQPPGILVAQNQYPGLQFLPIGSTNSELKEIPSPWPNLKIQQIPIVRPNFKLIPIADHALIAKPAPVK